MNNLTVKQKRILEIIKKFIDEKGYSPTVREITELANLNSPATIQTYLKILKEKGYIIYEKEKSRTIRIINEEKRI